MPACTARTGGVRRLGPHLADQTGGRPRSSTPPPGFSEWTPEQIRTAIDIAGPDVFVSSQPQYSNDE
ncbi:hypothetical protein [Streptomyces sp. NPDC052292]|uniref:hypothetical protein n=1 Tax=Streptomyces sp. NPDC052292 TaxID=3155053 RepID=UPI0034372067